MSLSKRAKWTFIALSAVDIIIGLCLIIWPQISALTLCVVFGVLTLAVGVVRIVFYFRRNVFGVPMYADLALGIFEVLIGIVLLIHPGDILRLIPVIIGIMITVDSVFKFQTAFDVRRAGMGAWWAVLLLAALSAAGGILLIVDPFEGAQALMIVMGAALTADGVQNICTAVCVSRYIRENIDSNNIYIGR